STGQVLGSPAHMAPEQIEGGEVDARADVFGLGVLLYECMVGHLPFEGNNPAQVLRRVLEGHYPNPVSERAVIGNRWGAVLDRALAHEPADRFPDADAMREALVAELERLAVPRPRRELEAWLDDPEAYEKQHAARMIAKLCALAADERKRGDVLLAAADYNRALAHAPDDPQLLRIVAGLNRAEARSKLLRRTAAALILMVGLGGAAYGVGRLVQHMRADIRPVPTEVLAAPPASVPTLIASTPAPSASASATASSAPRPVPPSTALVAPKLVDRSVQLDVTPSMGVVVTIDGSETHPAASGSMLRLDSKAHTLSFTCFADKREVCMAVVREVAASDKDETLVVKVPIKPAMLVIQGPVDKTYQLVEHPEVTVRAGTNTVALRSAYESVTVKQIDSNATVPVRLEAGGKPAQATF
ncbi:MAG TPA: protein kinase, partial [Polyangiaceae bacterium]|nr:protein kinase [Polyangiaceae bacterium]